MGWVLVEMVVRAVRGAVVGGMVLVGVAEGSEVVLCPLEGSDVLACPLEGGDVVRCPLEGGHVELCPLETLGDDMETLGLLISCGGSLAASGSCLDSLHSSFSMVSRNILTWTCFIYTLFVGARVIFHTAVTIIYFHNSLASNNWSHLCSLLDLEVMVRRN